MIIFYVDYEYFWRESLSLILIMIIFGVNYDDICRLLCLCGVYFIP